MADLITLLRSQSENMDFNGDFDPSWSVDKLWRHLITSDYLQPVIVYYNEDYNPSWSDDELYNHIIILRCLAVQVTSLPTLPHCRILQCPYSQLTTLPSLPNCEILVCTYNILTSPPFLPKCKELWCVGKDAPFGNLIRWKKFWSVKAKILGRKYLSLWYKKMIIKKGKRKEDIHNELKYSPDLPFYKQNTYLSGLWN